MERRATDSADIDESGATRKGKWDLGPRPVGSHAPPFSDQWRARARREADWSARVLSLLARYQDSRAARPTLPHGAGSG
jgi:hypothetical protein